MFGGRSWSPHFGGETAFASEMHQQAAILLTISKDSGTV